MRVAPINLASRRNFQPQKNINFGKIEEKNRQRIIDNLPFDKPCGGYKQEDADRDKEFDIAAIDHNNGVMVKWGGKGHPRGLIYADLIREHVDKSDYKEMYLGMTREYWGNNEFGARCNVCLDHLENGDNYSTFIANMHHLWLSENPDGTKVEILPSKSSSDNTYSEQEEREDNFIYGMFNRPL